jgi:PIN domain nuclease of toxin-antitoxin system
MLNLDTHVLLYALTDTLTPRERSLLSSDSWSISAIVLWEIAKLAQRGRIDIDLDDADLTRLLVRVHTWPLTVEVCREVAHLDFRSDPADEIIAATSVVHRIPLVTRDRKIRRSTKVPFPRSRRA